MPSAVRLSSSLLVALLASGCGGRSVEICEPQQAQEQGRQQAHQGLRLDVSLGGRCPSSSRASIEAGYAQGRREICRPDAAYGEGQNVGASGAPMSGLPARYRICSDGGAIAQQFDAGYVAGVRTFCDRSIAEAYQTGTVEGIKGGGASPPSASASCTAADERKFSVEWQRGYADGITTYCVAEQVEEQGSSDGAAGRPSADVGAAFRMCKPAVVKKIRARYAKSYKTGIDRFCGASVIAAFQAGQTSGSAGTNAAMTPLPSACSVDDTKRARAEWMRGRKAGLAQHCTADSAEAQGRADGGAGRAAVDAGAAYSTCEPAAVAQIRARYERAYGDELQQYCGSDRIATAASEAVRNGAQRPVLPGTFEVCTVRFPRIRGDYDQAFAAARTQRVAESCTYETGTRAGKTDADVTNDKKLAMPEFCDRANLAEYQRGYAAGWSERKAALCSVIEASNQGVDDAQAGRPFSYSAPTLCPADLHAGLLTAYRGGHKSVARVEPPLPSPPPPPPPDEEYYDDDDDYDDRDDRDDRRKNKRRRPPPATLEAADRACNPISYSTTERASCSRDVMGARFDATPVVAPCIALSYSTGERLECVRSASASRRDPSAGIQACIAISYSTSERLTCVSHLSGARSKRSTTAVAACVDLSYSTTERLTCVKFAVTLRGDPVPTIRACIARSYSTSERLQCLQDLAR